MKSLSCLSDIGLWKLIDGDLVDDIQGMERHLAVCKECRLRADQLRDDLALVTNPVRQPSLADLEKAIDDAWLSTTRLLSSTLENESTLFQPGERIDRYEVCDCLNSGGQGEVYLAFDRRLKRRVAIKVSRDRIGSAVDAQQWGEDEGELLARVNHPRLAQIYDTGVHRGHPYLVMEYVDGWTLVGELRRRQVTAAWIRDILNQICSAVAAIHAGGILHLDLKPENVMITPQGDCKLIDLGTAWVVSRQLASTQGFAGTPEYVAPEQLDGSSAELTVQTDIFGIGAILYFLLTGQSPRHFSTMFTEDHRAALIIRHQELLKLGTNKRLAAICVKALAPNPQDRYSSLTEILNDLNRSVVPKGFALSSLIAGILCLLLVGMTISMFPSLLNRPEQLAPQTFTPGRGVSPSRHVLDPTKPVRITLTVLPGKRTNLRCFAYLSKTQSLLPIMLEEVWEGNSNFWKLRTGSNGLALDVESGPVTFLVIDSEEAAKPINGRLLPPLKDHPCNDLPDSPHVVLFGADGTRNLLPTDADQSLQVLTNRLAFPGTAFRGVHIIPWALETTAPRLDIKLTFDNRGSIGRLDVFHSLLTPSPPMESKSPEPWLTSSIHGISDSEPSESERARPHATASSRHATARVPADGIQQDSSFR